MSEVTPISWEDTTVDNYSDLSARFTNYDDILFPRVWEFFYTGSIDTFVVPSGTERIKVECIGGGGRDNTTGTSGKDGGAGGSYAASYFNVTATETYDVYVGKGATAPDSDGEDSTFDVGNAKEVIGTGGYGKLSQLAGCVGNFLTRPGGSGGSRSSSSGSGGGGGGSAGANSSGATGENGFSSGSGGSGGSGNGTLLRGRGGAGGRRGVSSTLSMNGDPGQDGSFPGAGGGGGGWDASTPRLSGSGAHGYVKITEVA